MPKQTKAQKRTQALIDYYRGRPGEFYMLKGLLCLDLPFSDDDVTARTLAHRLVDSMMIAARMDELEAADAEKRMAP